MEKIEHAFATLLDPAFVLLQSYDQFHIEMSASSAYASDDESDMDFAVESDGRSSLFLAHAELRNLEQVNHAAEHNDQTQSALLSLPAELQGIITKDLTLSDLSRLCRTYHKSNWAFTEVLRSYAGYVDSAELVPGQQDESKKNSQSGSRTNQEDIRNKMNAMMFRIRDNVAPLRFRDDDSRYTLDGWDLSDLPERVTSCHLLIDLPFEEDPKEWEWLYRWTSGYDAAGVRNIIHSLVRGSRASYLSVSTNNDAFDPWRWLFPFLPSMAKFKTLCLTQPVGCSINPVRYEQWQPRPGSKNAGQIVIIAGHEGESGVDGTCRTFRYATSRKSGSDQLSDEPDRSQLDVLCQNLAHISRVFNESVSLSLVGSETWDLEGMGYEGEHTSDEAVQTYAQCLVNSHWSASSMVWPNSPPQYKFLTFEQARTQGLLPAQNGLHSIVRAEEGGRAADFFRASEDPGVESAS